MTDVLEFRHNVPIGRVTERGDVVMTLEFYQQLLALRDRALGGAAEDTTPARVFYQDDEPAAWRDGDLWHDTDDTQARTYRNVDGAAELVTDKTGANLALGLASGGTVAITAGGSVRAAMQPATQQIYDGQVLTWGPYDATPTLTIDPAPLPALASGEQYELAITGASATGGTASLKKRTTGGSLTTQTGSSVSTVASDPGSFDIQKPTSGDAYDSAYRFAITYAIRGVLVYGLESTEIYGSLTIGCYYRTTAGGAFTKIGDAVLAATAEGTATGQTTTLYFSGFPAIGQHADPEFRLVVEGRTYAESNLTAVSQVAYETISGGSTSTATPSDNPKLTLRIDPK